MPYRPAAARHSTVLGWKASVGQLLELPSELGVGSQAPAAARQTAVLFASAGQVTLVPVQVSARSQTPAAARHWTVLGWKTSVGQLLELPSQLSAASQAPAAARQTAVLFASAGPETPFPVHVLARMPTPAAAPHTTLLGWKTS